MYKIVSIALSLTSFIILYFFSKDNHITTEFQLYVNNLSRLEHYVKASNNTPKDEHEADTKKVLFVTEYRSGSTFLSTLLSHHPDAFYLFEPLILAEPRYSKFKDTKTRDEISAKILLDFYDKCIMPKAEEYLNEDILLQYRKENASISYKVYSHAKYCQKFGMCAPHKSGVFYGSAVCPDTLFGDPSIRMASFDRACPKFKGKLLFTEQILCPKYKIKAAKVIRTRSIEDIPKSLLDQGLKIVYLVRDPRGMISSRKSINSKTYDNDNKLSNVCKSQRLFLEQQTAFRKKYPMMVVRYEDFALNPILVAQKIYDYLDISFPESVKKELLEITSGNIDHKKFKSKSELLEVSDETYRYGTVRNSKKVVFKWKNHLKWEEVKVVQNACKDTMEEFGYKILDEIEYSSRNSDNFSAITEFNCNECSYRR